MNRIIIFISILVCLPIMSQELYVFPRLTNFKAKDFNAGNQNWAITEDDKGRLYFANNKGILEFDGYAWKLYSLPNNGIIRSAYYSNDGKLYVGGFEDFGYFSRNKYDALEYTSLKKLVQNYNFHNDEIWNIVDYDGKIIFQYFSSYFIFDGASVTVHKGIAPLNLLKSGERVYSQVIGKGLYEYSNKKFEEVLDRKLYGDDDIVAVLSITKSDLLLITRHKGIFKFDRSNNTVRKWDNAINEDLKAYTANRAILTKDSCIVIGTIANGVYALDKGGKLRWKINSKSGLANNTILGLHCDQNNNIWAALDNGISQIHHNSSVMIFNPDQQNNIGMVYDASIRPNGMYIATNQGLYFHDSGGKLKLIPSTEGQAWSISNIDGLMICGHNTGSFEINGDKVLKRISDISGARNIIKCQIHGQEILLQSTYTFLNVYRKDKNAKWHYSNKVKNFLQLIQHIEVDHAGNIWCEHKSRGVYRIKLDEALENAIDIQFYNKLKEKGNQKINIFKVLGRVVFSGKENELYTYDDLIDSIVAYKQLNEELPTLKDSYKVVKQNESKYWFVNNDYYSLVEYVNNHFQIIHQIPISIFNNPPMENKGNVFFDENDKVYFALDGALGIYDPNLHYQNSLLPRLYLKEISFSTDDNNDCLFSELDKRKEVEHKYNNFKVSLFTSSLKEKKYDVLYRLEGLDKENVWHRMGSNMDNTYSRLSFGSYTFKAILYKNGERVSVVSYSFVIKRPFYLSNLAIFVYIVVAILILAGIFYVVLKKANKKKNEEIEKQRQLIIELEKEQLKAEVKFKSKELSNFTMQSIKNKEFLSRIKRELQEQNIKSYTPKNFFDNLIRVIDEHIGSEDDWIIFQNNFDQIHESFFRILKNRYPDLTPNDLRMCALLRINLSSKDISNMMNISLRGIEAARYRLRKRLNIPTEQDLVDFLIHLK